MIPFCLMKSLWEISAGRREGYAEGSIDPLPHRSTRSVREHNAAWSIGERQDTRDTDRGSPSGTHASSSEDDAPDVSDLALAANVQGIRPLSADLSRMTSVARPSWVTVGDAPDDVGGMGGEALPSVVTVVDEDLQLIAERPTASSDVSGARPPKVVEPFDEHVRRRRWRGWVRPRVLVLGNKLPAHLRRERNFHLLTYEGLHALAERLERGGGPEAALIVALPEAFHAEEEQLTVLERLERLGVSILPLETVVERHCRLTHLDETHPPVREPSPITDGAKRLFDFVGGALGCSLFLAVLPAVATGIWLEDRGPVFYLQERVGRRDKRFRLIKFRSMRTDAEPSGPAWSTADDERLTRMGAILRRYHIDELPQFVNVLLGHMGIVGPRPERPTFVELLEHYLPHYRLRHASRPGITGWGTLKVGYSNSIEAKYLAHQYDLYYLNRRSLRFDLEIVARTALHLVLRPEVRNRFML